MSETIIQHIPRRPWWKRTWGSMFIFVGVGFLVVLALFSWMVFVRVRDVRAGRLSPITNFTSEFTVGKNGVATSTRDVSLVAANDPERGDPAGKVIVVEFGDFQCPFTGKEFPIIRSFMETMTGVHFVYRSFPLTDIHPDAMRAALAAYCAKDQGKFWEYHDQLFLNQQDLSLDALTRYASIVGLDQQKFTTCVQNETFRADVVKDMHDGQALGVAGTPTFFVNGTKVEGAVPFEAWQKIFDWFGV